MTCILCIFNNCGVTIIFKSRTNHHAEGDDGKEQKVLDGADDKEVQPERVHPVGLAQGGGTDLTTPDKLCHFAFPALTTDYQTVTPPRSRFFLHCNLHCNLHYNLHWPSNEQLLSLQSTKIPSPETGHFSSKRRRLSDERHRLFYFFTPRKPIFPGRKIRFSRRDENADWLFEILLHRVSVVTAQCRSKCRNKCRKSKFTQPVTSWKSAVSARSARFLSLYFTRAEIALCERG